jgi:hypothetical protein
MYVLKSRSGFLHTPAFSCKQLSVSTNNPVVPSVDESVTLQALTASFLSAESSDNTMKELATVHLGDDNKLFTYCSHIGFLHLTVVNPVKG